MPTPSVERKLAAIFAADVAGYSRLVGQDEAGTLARLKACRTVIDQLIADHRGRIFNTAGDSVVADFASAVDAVQCAVATQRSLADKSVGSAGEPMLFRVGIHVGDVVVDGTNLLGDGVNIAARLEGLAEPGGICVSGAARDHIGNKLPLGFDDLGEQQVKNIAQAIRVYRVQIETPATRPVAALPLPGKPSIAVLPFQNMSGDPDQEYFADGMVEDITTAIARLPWLFVIARNSSFTYKGKAVDVKQVARELGVRYVLEGSVRSVRITGQLIDTATGAHIWADRFDGALDDIFELQAQVASSVVGAIEPKLRLAEIERAVRKPTESLDAYDLYLRALVEFHKLTPDGWDAAISLLRQALAIDPAYAPAAGMIGYVRNYQTFGGVQLSNADVSDALRLARHAITVGGNDPDALWMGGHTLATLAGEHAAGLSAIERATTLNPNCALAWWSRAAVHCFTNRPDAAIAALERAIRLSPLDPLGYNFKFILAYALMLAGRYQEAMEWVDRSLHDRPSNHPAIRGKVALCGYLGRVEEGREWVRRLLEANPAMTIAGFKAFGTNFLSAGTIAVWVEGFRRAGLPEE